MIATSSGRNDSGLFEPNLRDERYLPFEGAGALSEWRIELPAGFRQFDYDTISDVVDAGALGALPDQSIADALEIPLGTVKSRMHHALAALRDDPACRKYFERD